MNFVRQLRPVVNSAPALDAIRPIPPTAQMPPLQPGSPVDTLIRQLEDDVRFTMSLIGYEADKSRTMIEESVGHVERIGAAGDELFALSEAAGEVAASLSKTTARLESANEAIQRDVAGADQFINEARGAAAEVAASMARLNEVVALIDHVKHVISMIARQTNVLALNAGIESARAGPEGRSLGVLASEIKSLASKAQKATLDITTQMGALQSVAHQSSASVGRISKMIRRIEPVIGSIRNSAQEQGFATEQASARAQETVNFVTDVAAKSREFKHLADDANLASQKAKKAGNHVVFALQRYEQRSTVYLRNSDIGNRRRHERVPVKLPCTVTLAGVKAHATVLDISEGGALVILGKANVRVGSRSRLSMASLGDCTGYVVGISELGVHFSFDELAPDFVLRIRRLIASVANSEAVFRNLAIDGATEIAAAFNDALSFGEIDLADLITTDYRPVEGSDPVQHITKATSFYDRILPPLTEKYWSSTPNPIFAVAADRNAYLPVHHPKYSLPQRPNEWEWNDLNSRHRRIMERWQMLVISRNTERCLVKVFLRHMKGGEIVPVKVYASPIFVNGQLWGNFQLSYFY